MIDEHLGEEKARVYRRTVARLNNWAVDRPDLQHAVRVCSKAAAKPTADDWLTLFAWQTVSTKLTVQSDSD